MAKGNEGKERKVIRQFRLSVARLSHMIIGAALAVGGLGIAPGHAGHTVTREAAAASVDSGQEAASSDNGFSMSGGDLEAVISYGLDGYAQPGKYMALTATVTNQGEDFTGKLLVVIEGGRDIGGGIDNYGYQKDMAIPSGETKAVSVTFPVNNNTSRLQVRILNKKGRDVCYRDINIGYNTNSTYIGVLSDQEEKLGYLRSGVNQVVYLQPEDISEDYKAIDVLDLLVITEKDTSALSKQQVKGLEDWIRQGGTLVIGVSANAQKELGAFSDTLVQWSAGEYQETKTRFGLRDSDLSSVRRQLVREEKDKRLQKVKQFLQQNLSKEVYDTWSYEIANLNGDWEYVLSEEGQVYQYLLKQYEAEELDELLRIDLNKEEKAQITQSLEIKAVQKAMVPLQIRDAKVIALDGDWQVLQRLSVGKGNIIISEASLTLDNEDWESTGAAVRSMLLEAVSASGSYSDSDMYGYDFEDSLSVNDTDRLPNLSLYGVLLLLYVFLVGILLWLVLKKKNRLHLMWVLIPGTAVIFSLLIYLIGTSTRISGPYTNYMSQIVLSEEGQSQATTWFQLANSSNRDYTVVLKGNHDVEPLRSEESYYDTRNQSLKKLEYQYAITYGAEETAIEMQNLAAFEGKNFVEQELVNIKGKLKANITSDNKKLSGTVTNNMKFNLKDSLLYDSGRVIQLGDIPAGKSVSLDLVSKDKILEPEDYDGIEDLTMKLYDASYFFSVGGNATDRRRATLLYHYIETIGEGSCFLYGYVEDPADAGTVVNELGMDTRGITGLASQLDINYTYKEGELLPDLSQYAQNLDYSVTDGHNIIDPSVNKLEITYKLPEGYEWKQLLYNSKNNPEFSMTQTDYSSVGFLGNIKLKDQHSGKKRVIFKSGRGKVLENLKPYLNSDGSLTLYYKLNQTSGLDSIQLPHIMVAVEKKGQIQEVKGQ